MRSKHLTWILRTILAFYGAETTQADTGSFRANLQSSTNYASISTGITDRTASVTFSVNINNSLVVSQLSTSTPKILSASIYWNTSSSSKIDTIIHTTETTSISVSPQETPLVANETIISTIRSPDGLILTTTVRSLATHKASLSSSSLVQATTFRSSETIAHPSASPVPGPSVTNTLDIICANDSFDPTCVPIPTLTPNSPNMTCIFALQQACLPPQDPEELLPAEYCSDWAFDPLCLQPPVFPTPTATAEPNPLTICGVTPFHSLCLQEAPVTNSITTVPGVTVLTETRTEITQNTVITTTDDKGHPTVVPVIICPKCGPNIVLILLKLPPIPNISFRLPGFPKLPRFHFPCIPIPLIRSCKKPPTIKGHNPPPPTPPVTEPEPNEEDTDECETITVPSCTTFVTAQLDSRGSTTATMTSSTCSDIKGCSATSKGTATTSSQSGECKTVTPPVCSTFVTEKVDTSASTTERITTSTCSDVVVCSATPSSTATTTTSSVASPGPTLAIYDIHARQDVPWTLITAFTERLKNETKAETLYIEQLEAAQLIIYWRQYLTPEQAEEYKQDPAVGAVVPDSNLFLDHGIDITFDFIAQPIEESLDETERMRKRAIPVVPWTDTKFSPDGVGNDLKLISLPDGVKLADVNNYAYRDEKPNAARIYIIDSGMDTSTEAYRSLSPEPDWIFPGENLIQGEDAFDFQRVKNDWQPSLHGTCMASKAVGEPFGVSKKAALTIVRLPEPIQTQKEKEAGKTPQARTKPIINALQQVHKDIWKRDSGPLSVVSISASFSDQHALDPKNLLNSFPGPGHQLWPLFKILQKLTNTGASVVVSGGNYRKLGADYEIIRHAPAIWNHLLPIIVVGAVNDLGKRIPEQPFKSNRFWPAAKIDVYAPGYPAICASNPGASALSPYGSRNTLGHEAQWATGSSAATASVAGLVAYFMTTPGHADRIDELVQSEFLRDPDAPPAEIAKIMRDYIISKSINRSKENDPAYPAKVAYNGEVPQLKTGVSACNGPNVPAFKRDEGSPTCLLPDQPSEYPSSDASFTSLLATGTPGTSFSTPTKDTTRAATFSTATSVSTDPLSSSSSISSKTSSMMISDKTNSASSASVGSKIPDGSVPYHGFGKPRSQTPSPVSTSLSGTTPPPPVPTTIAPIPPPPPPPAPVQTQPAPPPSPPEAPKDPSCEKWSDCPQDMCAGKKGQSPQCFKKHCACF
ncbi:hypothetical protein HYFRA_00009472 [Hymenoscyphus fraxineus]|uniref:Peptidase S8/S53 domain-containing protein n=1 Tax=Hymenoscyphus fraxineus TaxID=746836 RepID=A0A9N9PJ91_9HELO|nr:hypothetical protein HYFRA_00009472 [Hymenoscyphus fraxineus]